MEREKLGLKKEGVQDGLVSIIMPVYNAEKFLNKSVESVLGQSYRQIELLLIDDGSCDGSKSVCRAYADSYPRVKVLSQENRGPAAARNNGLKHAAGQYILFLDADDLITANAVEMLVSACVRNRADLVICNFSKQTGEGEPVPQRVSFTPENESFTGSVRYLTPDDMCGFVRHFLKFPSNHLVSYCWARLYKRALIEEYGIAAPEEMRLFEDFIFNLEYISHASRVIFLNAPLYVYVMHNSHVSASMSIINSKSLLHDMHIFRDRTGLYLRTHAGTILQTDIDREIGHTLIHYLIIFLVRSCRQLTPQTRRRIFGEIDVMVRAPIIRESLKHYSPSKGNSRMLPILMKLKLVGAIMSVCRFKANKRYGKAR